MATTHKLPPVRIAEQVIESNPFTGSPDELEAHIRDLIMLGIAAYNDANNQRPEKLAEACARLGMPLSWKFRGDIDKLPDNHSFALFFGHGVPLRTFHRAEEELLILEAEYLRQTYPEVSTWVEAVL